MASCAVTERLTVKDDEEKKKKSHAASASFRELPKRTTQHKFLEGIARHKCPPGPLDDTNSGTSGVLVTAKL